jgi:hypothetical protein
MSSHTTIRNPGAIAFGLFFAGVKRLVPRRAARMVGCAHSTIEEEDLAG